MFPLRRRAAASSALAFAIVLSSPALPGQGYSLKPGELVIADSPGPGASTGDYGAVRVLHHDGTVSTLAAGWPFEEPADVILDRDGAVLVSSFTAPSSPFNGVYRLDPASGALDRLNALILDDNFGLIRDGKGDLIVADGFRGLKRIDAHGNVLLVAPPSFGTWTNTGITLDYDGSYLISEATYAAGGPPGALFRVTPGGQRTLIAQDPQLPNPTSLVLDEDGAVLACDSWVFSQPARHGIVRVERNGVATTLSSAGLTYPRDVAVLGRGFLAIAETGEEAILVREPGGTLRNLVDEDDDGDPYNGLPVDRPIGIAFVPWLWLTTPMNVQPGQVAELRVRAPQALAGERVRVAVSLDPGPSALAPWWPGSPRTSHVGLANAQTLGGRLGPNGELVIRHRVPSSVPWGETLHVQAFLDARRWVSNYVALPVRF